MKKKFTRALMTGRAKRYGKTYHTFTKSHMMLFLAKHKHPIISNTAGWMNFPVTLLAVPIPVPLVWHWPPENVSSK
jgi:hypothetical protein